MIGLIHRQLVFNRRVTVLTRELLAAIPPETGTVLDVGCGDGMIDAMLMQARPGLSITGIDVLVRPDLHVPVQWFDGTTLPFADGSFDVVMCADVLHHTTDPTVLLREAKRVARQALVLKDHTRDGLFSNLTLRFMDWVGNSHHGVALPYNYWSRQRWMSAFESLGLSVTQWRDTLGLYPKPASWIFDRRLHFVASLRRLP